MSDRIKAARRAYLAKRNELVDALKEARGRAAESRRGSEASAEEIVRQFPALRGAPSGADNGPPKEAS